MAHIELTQEEKEQAKGNIKVPVDELLSQE